jgi:hypothetical protein
VTGPFIRRPVMRRPPPEQKKGVAGATRGRLDFGATGGDCNQHVLDDHLVVVSAGMSRQMFKLAQEAPPERETTQPRTAPQAQCAQMESVRDTWVSDSKFGASAWHALWLVIGLTFSVSAGG